MKSPKRAELLLRDALDSIPHSLASYAPDGGWAESPGYWHYGTSYTVIFLAALQSALNTDFGLSAAKGFDHTGRFRIYCSSASGKTFNYADAHDHTEPAPEMFWLARRFAEPVYAWQEQRLLDAGGVPHTLDLVWFQPDGRSPKQAGWPLDAIFHGVQAAFLRSSWDDANAVFVGIKGGDNKANHGNLDLGAFVLDGGGVRWALDLGPDDYNLPAYFGSQHWRSHSTVMIDNESQDPHAEASISAHLFSPDLSWVEVDLSHALSPFKNVPAPHRYRAGPAGIHSRCARKRAAGGSALGDAHRCRCESRRADGRTPKERVDAIRGNPHTPACGF